jgi:hypothetical protein
MEYRASRDARQDGAQQEIGTFLSDDQQRTVTFWVVLKYENCRPVPIHPISSCCLPQ